MRKPRLLMCTEASYLPTGFATYGREVQQRLYDTGKYDLAELGSYGHQSDPRQAEFPWKFYGNLPDNNQVGEYNTKATNQFGEWRFEAVANDFRPDIVWDCRDWWMWSHEETSPFRPYYHHVVMPTVDAEPQARQWIASFIHADRVLTYTDWAQDVLRREGGGLIRLAGTAPPGADLKTFTPLEKPPLRVKFGLEEDVNIVGTVMRNQMRKLYPDLMEAFVTFLQKADPALSRKTFLYLHVSFPDLAWDIPALLKTYGLGHKTLVTYACKSCGNIFPAFYQDTKARCADCGARNAIMPTVEEGVGRATLAQIYNLFDVYVQYSNSEGFGMPQVEAAACGVPVMAVDYSGMHDVLEKIGGVPIEVDRYTIDPDMGCRRALPDNADFVKKLISFFTKPESMRKKMIQRGRDAVESHYTWERTAKIWEGVFDALPLRPLEETWESPPKIHPLPPIPTEFANHEEFVRWAIVNVLGRPDLTESYLASRLIRDLNWAKTTASMGGNYHNEASMLGVHIRPQPFSAEDAVRRLAEMAEYRNHWEKIRCRIV